MATKDKKKKSIVDVDMRNMPKHPETDAELAPDADIEEQFNAFWRKNGGSIFAAIAVAFTLIIGIKLYEYWQLRQKEALMDAYTVAAEEGDLADFVREHEGTPIAAFAQMKLAHDLYAAGSYAEAAKAYDAFEKVEGDLCLKERSVFGHAMALLAGNNPQEGVEALKAITENMQFRGIQRAEAFYQLAIYYWSKENYSEMKAALEGIDGIAQPGFWAMRASLLRDKLPEALLVEPSAEENSDAP